MSRAETIEVEGRVIEVLPKTLFRVELANGHRVLAHTSGRMRMNFLRISPGDVVKLQLSPYDLSKGCIVFEEKKEN